MSWLANSQHKHFGVKVDLPEFLNLSLSVWNAGCNAEKGIDWNGLPIFIELYGIKDTELLINDLLTIQEFVKHKDDE